MSGKKEDTKSYSALVQYAEQEMGRLEWKEDKYNKLLFDCVLELVKTFARQDHSGFSAQVTLQLFERVARFLPLSPMTGEDWEWVEYAEDKFQNRRDGLVFKDGKDGPAYRLDGVVFIDEQGCSYTNRFSKIPVKFPFYTPKEPVKMKIRKGVTRQQLEVAEQQDEPEKYRALFKKV